jgi:hypothetical protein
MLDQDTLEQVQAEVNSVETPVVINPSTTGEHLTSGVRDLVIFIGGFSAFIGFIGKRDLAGMVAWLQSSEAYPFLGLVLAGATLVWRHIRIRTKKSELVSVGLMAPNSAAVVLGVDIPKKGA